MGCRRHTSKANAAKAARLIAMADEGEVGGTRNLSCASWSRPAAESTIQLERQSHVHELVELDFTSGRHHLSRGVEPGLSLVSTCQASYEAREVVLTGKRHKQRHNWRQHFFTSGIISLMPHLNRYYKYTYAYTVSSCYCLHRKMAVVNCSLVVRVACFAAHTALQVKS